MYYIRGLISLCSSLTQTKIANNATYVGHVFILFLKCFYSSIKSFFIPKSVFFTTRTKYKYRLIYETLILISSHFVPIPSLNFYAFAIRQCQRQRYVFPGCPLDRLSVQFIRSDIVTTTSHEWLEQL